MRLWLIRYPDGTFQGSPVETNNQVKNIHLSATWRHPDEVARAKQIAREFGGVAVPFDYENGVMTEAVSQERAREIYAARGPMGEWPKGSYTETEDFYISKVWNKMNGCHSWADALMAICQGAKLS